MCVSEGVCVSVWVSVCLCVFVCVRVCLHPHMRLVAQSCLIQQPQRQQTARLLCPWDFPGKNTRTGCHFLCQRIFPTQGSSPHLLHR